MRSSSYALLAALLGALLLGVPGTAGAQTINTTLDEFLAEGDYASGLDVGDKRYSNFTFSATGDAPVTANMIDVALVATETQHQIRFTFARDALDAPAGQTTDLVICYQIDVLGNQLINGVELRFDADVTGGNGMAKATVAERVQTTDGSDLAPGGVQDSDRAELSVLVGSADPTDDNTTDTLEVRPTRSLVFCKDILVSSRAGGGRVVISTVDNLVTQVPEPTAAAFVGAAGMLLLARRRRA